MKIISATKARNNFYKLIDETVKANEPILITGKKNNAVLLSENNWRAIQETLFLVSIRGIRESVLKGLETPICKCSNKLKW